MGLLDDFERGIGMFGPLALPSERRLAERIGPALAGVMGEGIRAGADVEGNRLRSQAQITGTGMKEAGDTFRQRLVNDASILMREMMEKGALTREGMSQAGQTTRTRMGEEGAMSRLKKKALLDETAFDNILMSAFRRSNAGSYAGSPGDVGVIDRIEEGSRRRSPGLASPDPLSRYMDDYDYSSGTW